MLPAQKQEKASTNPTASAAGGFGKVLNSIHGLQQRLDDFSVEDVSHAQAKAENLIRELSFLQLKLNCLAVTGQTFSEAQRIIRSIPDDNFDRIDLDSLEKYPTLHLLIKASQLIELVRPRAKSFARYIDELTATHESAESITVHFNPQIMKALPSPFTQGESSSADEANGGVVSVLVPAETEADVAAITSADKDRAPSAEEASADLLSMPKNQDSEPENPVATARDQVSKSASLVVQPQSDTVGEKTPTAAKSDFDQRLLDDLINSYGDFASAPDLPVPGKASKPATLKASERNTRTVQVAAQAANVAAGPREKPPVKITTTNAVHANIRQADEPQRAEESGTSLTKQGEIDRQLKNIIKDYGEYDLYKRQSPLNLKVAGIVAFALLGLALCGFYFFKSPVPSAPINSAVQSETKSSSGFHVGDGMDKAGAGDQSRDRAINTKQTK